MIVNFRAKYGELTEQTLRQYVKDTLRESGEISTTAWVALHALGRISDEVGLNIETVIEQEMAAFQSLIVREQNFLSFIDERLAIAEPDEALLRGLYLGGEALGWDTGRVDQVVTERYAALRSLSYSTEQQGDNVTAGQSKFTKSFDQVGLVSENPEEKVESTLVSEAGVADGHTKDLSERTDERLVSGNVPPRFRANLQRVARSKWAVPAAGAVLVSTAAIFIALPGESEKEVVFDDVVLPSGGFRLSSPPKNYEFIASTFGDGEDLYDQLQVDMQANCESDGSRLNVSLWYNWKDYNGVKSALRAKSQGRTHTKPFSTEIFLEAKYSCLPPYGVQNKAESASAKVHRSDRYHNPLELPNYSVGGDLFDFIGSGTTGSIALESAWNSAHAFCQEHAVGKNAQYGDLDFFLPDQPSFYCLENKKQIARIAGGCVQKGLFTEVFGSSNLEEARSRYEEYWYRGPSQAAHKNGGIWSSYDEAKWLEGNYGAISRSICGN